MKKPLHQVIFSVSILATVILSGCLPAALIPSPTPAGGRYEKADCMFGNEKGIECGYLVVPEDRSQPDGTQIRLAVAIIRSSSAEPAPDPVVILYGGPGSLIVEATPALSHYFARILVKRDLIVIDQRGVGYSSPALECPEVENQALLDATQNLSPAEEQEHSLKAYQTCHDRLEEEGVALSAYNSAASAADLNDLRMALGYDQWNLYGYGYGARLALTVMRDFPEGLRSVVLDSVYPPQADLDTETAANNERALNLLFERCAADSKCNASYPDLKSVFYDAAAQLDANPISFDQTSQQNNKKYTVLINGNRLIKLTIYLLGWDNMLPYIPKWIYEFHNGTARSDLMLASYMYFFTFPYELFSEGTRMSVQCSEESSFSSTQDIQAADAAVSPRLAEAINQGAAFSLCSAWDVEPAAAIENKPVVSEIPTLLLTGDNDPATSPIWAKSTAGGLNNSYSFEFPWASHWLIYGDTPAAGCAQSMMSAFIADPVSKPDSACIDLLKVTFETQ